MSTTHTREVPRPTEVEAMGNLLLGPQDGVRPLPAPAGAGVLAALEAVLVPPLARPPCLVSFSGGRDSSAVLAVATAVARNHGLDDPVPAIMRFAAAPQTDETRWQELVLDHLRLKRVEVLDLRDELDALGRYALPMLARHGVRWPGNAYMHGPLLELAGGGALLTGIGGDELLGTSAARHVLIAHRRARPRPRDLGGIAVAALPRAARRRVWLRRHSPPYPWLTPAGASLVHRGLATDETAWPHRWDRSLRHWHRSRAFGALSGILPMVAAEHRVQVVNPLIDPGVLAAFVAAGGPTGFASRTAAMRQLFGTLLPDPILSRESKAAFAGPLWGPAVREFAGDWQGQGVDPDLIDVAALRGEWQAAEPDFRTVLLLHRAYLAAEASGQAAEQP